MINSLLKFLGGTPKAKPRNVSRPRDAGDSVYIPDHVVAVQARSQGPEALRELLRITVRDVARDRGMPLEWLGCEVMTMSKQGKVGFQVKVVIHHWDEQIMLFSRAFELAYLERVRSISLEAAQAFRTMVWSIADGAGCPYDKMPENEFWSEASRHEREVLQKYRDVDRLLALTKSPEHSSINKNTEPMALDEKRPLIAGQLIID